MTCRLPVDHGGIVASRRHLSQQTIFAELAIGPKVVCDAVLVRMHYVCTLAQYHFADPT